MSAKLDPVPFTSVLVRKHGRTAYRRPFAGLLTQQIRDRLLHDLCECQVQSFTIDTRKQLTIEVL
jgi:hypothetical protein